MKIDWIKLLNCLHYRLNYTLDTVNFTIYLLYIVNLICLLLQEMVSILINTAVLKKSFANCYLFP